MEVGDAKLQLGVEGEEKVNSALNNVGKSLDKMSGTFKKGGLAMMGVGTALAGSLIAVTMKTAQAGDEIAKMAKRTGFATETLSELRYVADLSGASLTDIEKATKRMSSAIFDASMGLETYMRSFEQLGINVQELQGLAPEEQFWTIAFALADLEDHTLKVALAQDIFGRAGTNLLPMLEEGSGAIADMRQEAHDLGVVFDKESAEQAEKFNDSLTTLKTGLQGVGKEIGMALMPILTNLVEKGQAIVAVIKDWVAAHPELSKQLLILAGVLIGAGGVLFALSQIAKMIVAINAALAIFHALSGPAGWIKLAAGLAIAGGAIFAMTKLMGGLFEMPEIPGTPAEEEKAKKAAWYREQGLQPPEELRGYQFGGIVPGPIGKPVPIIAHGGELFGGVGGKGLIQPISVYVTVEGSVIRETELVDRLREEFIRIKDRNTTTGF